MTSSHFSLSSYFPINHVGMEIFQQSFPTMSFPPVLDVADFLVGLLPIFRDHLKEHGIVQMLIIGCEAAILVQLDDLEKIESIDLAQKARVKWEIESGENSKFFHGLINSRRKSQMIQGIMHEGIWLTDPSVIKETFVNFYKDKFSCQDSQVSFPLFIPTHRLHTSDRDSLEAIVSMDEIKMVVWECGSNKALGPDGYSFMFIKIFWELLKHDIQEFVDSFFASDKFPQGENSAFITLIPKVPNPLFIKDYRPISLIGFHYKIVAKIIANRLSKVIDSIISPEQSAFISGRQILDGPLILSEIVGWYKKRKKKLMLFKVDFEKAFDSVSWRYLDYILDKLGFGIKWRSWIKSCLSSARTSILINGSPTSEFSLKRGLRQGDPLSPFLFIIVMEGLHMALNDGMAANLFHDIKLNSLNIHLSHLFYADDVIILSEWNQKDMENIIRILNVFHIASAGVFPFSYLGLPIGSNMSRIASWQILIDRFKARMSSWKANLLSIGGHLTLIKSVFKA
ncbi:putative RNA-directed DNA polymerase, eukaryota, reverse transcriptase zinc-binding domain protein [Tanacetum coccineum]